MIGDLRSVPGASAEEPTTESKVWRLDLPVNGTLILGCSSVCDLILPALMVSQHHARLDITNGTPVISEIGHTSGIYVDGKRTHHGEIAVGDVVRLGPFKIEFEDEAVRQAAELGIPAAKLAAPLIIMFAVAATWFGAFNAAREIVKEMPIFLRDRLSGLRVLPYLLSKVIVLAALCVVQTVVLVAILTVRADIPASGVLMWARWKSGLASPWRRSLLRAWVCSFRPLSEIPIERKAWYRSS